MIKLLTDVLNKLNRDMGDQQKSAGTYMLMYKTLFSEKDRFSIAIFRGRTKFIEIRKFNDDPEEAARNILEFFVEKGIKTEWGRIVK